MNKWMNEWMSEWMNEWMNESANPLWSINNQHLICLPQERLPILQQPAFFGLQLVDWLTAALKSLDTDVFEEVVEDAHQHNAVDEGFVAHEPVKHKIYGAAKENNDGVDGGKSDGVDATPMSHKKSGDHLRQQQRHCHLRHLVTQVCTLLLAVGTLKSTEDRPSRGKSVFKVRAWMRVFT